MDSTGMNYTRTPVVVPPAKVLAPPPRKKRTAPRPPSQICIPEQSVPDIPAASLKSEPAYAVIVKRPQLCMSTPNLSGPIPELDCNGNSSKSPDDDSSDGHYATLDLKPPVVIINIHVFYRQYKTYHQKLLNIMFLCFFCSVHEQ